MKTDPTPTGWFFKWVQLQVMNGHDKKQGRHFPAKTVGELNDFLNKINYV